jgi:hypothetical protein
VLVLECCDQRLHPANTGAIWYRLDVVQTGIAQLEMAAVVIEGVVRVLSIRKRPLRNER